MAASAEEPKRAKLFLAAALPTSAASVTVDATCEGHSGCAALNLTGDCCPGNGGVMLDCCNAECALHAECATANLTGYCCPTVEATMLGCCSGDYEAAREAQAPQPAQEEPQRATLSLAAAPSSEADDLVDTTCEGHFACAALNLTGSCCPGNGGVMLDCCNAQCSLHAECAKANLTGYCCPTVEAKMLGCCGGDHEAADELHQGQHNGDMIPIAQEPMQAAVLRTATPSSDTAQSMGTRCEAHSACAALNLTGACCPGNGGLMLDCCKAQCSMHPTCAEANLTGYCCPTVEAKMLGCCSGDADYDTMRVALHPRQGKDRKLSDELLEPAQETSLAMGTNATLLQLASGRVFRCGGVVCARDSICCQSRETSAAVCCAGHHACRFSSYNVGAGLHTVNVDGWGTPKCYTCTGQSCKDRYGGSLS